MKNARNKGLLSCIVAVMTAVSFSMSVFATEIPDELTVASEQTATEKIQESEKNGNGVILKTTNITTQTNEVVVDVSGSYDSGILMVYEYSQDEEFVWLGKHCTKLGQIIASDLSEGENTVKLTQNPSGGKNLIVALKGSASGEEMTIYTSDIVVIMAEKQEQSHGIKLLTPTITTKTQQVKVQINGMFTAGILMVYELPQDKPFEWNADYCKQLGLLGYKDFKIGENIITLTNKPSKGNKVVVAINGAPNAEAWKVYQSEEVLVEAIVSSDNLEILLPDEVKNIDKDLNVKIASNFTLNNGALLIFEYPVNEKFNFNNINKDGYQRLALLLPNQIKIGEQKITLSASPTAGKKIIAIINTDRGGEALSFESNSPLVTMEDYEAAITITQKEISAQDNYIIVNGTIAEKSVSNGSTALYAYPEEMGKLDIDDSRTVRLGTVGKPVQGSYTFENVDLSHCIGYHVVAVLRVPTPKNPLEFNNFYSNEVVVTGSYETVTPKIQIVDTEMVEGRKSIELSMNYTRNLKPRFSVFAYPTGEEFELGKNTVLLATDSAEIAQGKRVLLSRSVNADESIMAILFTTLQQVRSNVVKVERTKTNRPLVLLYNLDEDSYRGELLRSILKELNIEYKTIGKESLSQKVGYLAELQGIENNPKPHTGDIYEDEFMIISCLQEKQLDTFLAKMMKNGLRINHKAQVTDTNKDWTLFQLMNDIGNEHAVFQELIRLNKLVAEAETFKESDYDAEKWVGFAQKLEVAITALKTHEPPIELLNTAHDELLGEILKLTGKHGISGRVVLHCVKNQELYNITAEVMGGIKDAEYQYIWSNNATGKTITGVSASELRALKAEVMGAGDYYGKFPKVGLSVPSTVSMVSANLKNGALTVSWSPHETEENIPEIEDYVVEVYSGDSLIKTQTVGAYKTRVEIQDLGKSNEYTVKIYATNAVGRCDKTVVDVVEKQESVSSNKKSNRRRSFDARVNEQVQEAITQNKFASPKVDVSKNPFVGVSTFEKLKQSNKASIVFEGRGYTWEFAKAEEQNKVPGLIYLDTTIETVSPNEQKIKAITGEKEVLFFHFKHHGKLPSIAKITVDVSTKYENKTLNVYYYNEENNQLEEVELMIPINDGKISFIIDHCSDYVVTPETLTGAVKTEKQHENPQTGGIILIKNPIALVGAPIAILLVMGVSLYKKSSL